MRTSNKSKKLKIVKSCGGKKSGGCNTWAGATIGITTIKIAA